MDEEEPMEVDDAETPMEVDTPVVLDDNDRYLIHLLETNFENEVTVYWETEQGRDITKKTIISPTFINIIFLYFQVFPETVRRQLWTREPSSSIYTTQG